MYQFALDLPMPPSVNKVTARLGNSSSIIKKWRKNCEAVMMANGTRMPKPIDGWFMAEIIWDRQFQGKRDIDNSVKPLLDYIEQILQLIENDRYCQALSVGWGYAPEGCRIVITECEDNAI